MKQNSSAEVASPVGGECVLIHSWILTNHDSLMIPSATATPVSNHTSRLTRLENEFRNIKIIYFQILVLL